MYIASLPDKHIWPYDIQQYTWCRLFITKPMTCHCGQSQCVYLLVYVNITGEAFVTLIGGKPIQYYIHPCVAQYYIHPCVASSWWCKELCMYGVWQCLWLNTFCRPCGINRKCCSSVTIRTLHVWGYQLK